MDVRRIECTESPQVMISCGGDLQIRGWEEKDLLVKGDIEPPPTKEPEEVSEPLAKVNLEAKGDLQLKVPYSSSLLLEEVAGDLALKNVAGPLTLKMGFGDALLRNIASIHVEQLQGDLSARNIDETVDIEMVMGDVALRNIHELTVGTIHGDLVASHINGSVELNEVYGDVALSTVNRDIQISDVHRDVSLRNLGGRVVASIVHGDIRLLGSLSPGKHVLSADGDIVLRWPVSEPINLQAEAPKIENRLPLENVVERDSYLSGQIGDGESFLNLQAKGRIILKETVTTKDYWQDDANADFDVDIGFTDFGAQIMEEINSRVGEWTSRIESELEPKLAKKLEKTARKAAVRAEKAAERAVRKAEKAARKARWQEQTQAWQASASPRTSKKGASTGPTQEEQLKILKMVENGVISPEEANSLLEAIGE